jgi:hypothetical protein
MLRARIRPRQDSPDSAAELPATIRLHLHPVARPPQPVRAFLRLLRAIDENDCQAEAEATETLRHAGFWVRVDRTRRTGRPL